MVVGLHVSNYLCLCQIFFVSQVTILKLNRNTFFWVWASCQDACDSAMHDKRHTNILTKLELRISLLFLLLQMFLFHEL